MKIKFITLMSILLMVASASSLLANPVIFSNPYNSGTGATYTSSRSENGDIFFQSYADYYYDNSYVLTDFHWWGVRNPSEGFEINIYDNDDSDFDMPGDVVYTQWVDIGDANAEFVETNAFNGEDVYKYSIDFTTPFTNTASGLYWFSVIAVGHGWAWALGNDSPWNQDLQWSFVSEDWTGNPGNIFGDFAYEVTGERISDVPEPATLTLFGLGLLGSALARRRRNKK